MSSKSRTAIMDTVEHQNKETSGSCVSGSCRAVVSSAEPQTFFVTERVSEELIARVDLGTLQIAVPIAVHQARDP